MSFKFQGILYLDLIGKDIYAKHKFNKKWDDFKKIGKIIDETKNTLKILTVGGKIKTYVKSHYIFRLWVSDNTGREYLLEFDGEKILGTPAERIKKFKKIRRKLH